MPTNYSEKEVVRIIDKVANGLCREFRFGYYTLDDIRQQARVFALEGLSRYDEGRPLENFLWVHVRNRLINFKRDEYERCESPCSKCKQRVEQKCQHSDVLSCLIYRKWLSRNTTKKNLMIPIDISYVEDEKEDSMKVYEYANDIPDRNEVEQLIDQNLPNEYRKDYLKIKAGDHINCVRKLKIQNIIEKILEDNNYEY